MTALTCLVQTRCTAAESRQQTVTLDLTGVDIHVALKQLFERTGLKYDVDTSISGTVDISIRDTSLELALKAVLRACKGPGPLTYRLEDGSYRIVRDEGAVCRARAIAAVNDLLGHFWEGDAETGHSMDTYGGYPNPKPPNERGVLWERATFVAVIEGLYRVTKEPKLKQRLASDWSRLKSKFTSAELESCGNGSLNPACDDAGWSAIMYLNFHRATGDPEALNRAKRLVMQSYDRWQDDKFGGGLHYNDSRSFKSSYQAVLILAGIRIYEVTKDRRYYDRALQLYDWVEKTLLRPDGLYWWVYESAHDQDPGHPRNLGACREAYSDTFLGGNIAMGITHASLYQITGEESYRKRAIRTAEAVLAHETNAGVLIDDRDAWANGYLMVDWAKSVLTLPGIKDDSRSLLLKTAASIYERARTSDGYYSGCWSGPPEGSGCAWCVADGQGSNGQRSSPQQIMTSSSAVSTIVAATALDQLAR